MPFGLWKSKWEIHREDMARRDAEWREAMGRRDAEWRKERAERQAATERRDAEWSAYCAKSDKEFAEWRAAEDRRHEEWLKDRSEWAKRHDELMARIDENHRETMAALNIAIDELRAIRRDLNDLRDAVNANTEAVLKLIDRFDEWEGRPPGAGRIGPRSA